jgi:ubiquinone/menaquinone biosynthesis C-methylase UbiE
MEAGMANTASKPYKGWGMEGFVAEWYARQTARDLEEIRQTARHIATNLNSSSRVLEVAPGPGYLAIELARLSGASVTGVDISRSFVRIARDNASKADVRVEFEHGDAADLPFPDAQFDFVACRAAFKNFSRPLAAINEMHRVLKPRNWGDHRFAQRFLAACGEGLYEKTWLTCGLANQTHVQRHAKEARLYE